MKVGSLVECINDQPIPQTFSFEPNLKRGNIYTVTHIYGKEFVLIRVKEIDIPFDPDHPSAGFWIGRFREVQPPMEISVEEILKDFEPSKIK
jgi:hypothetical protein